MVSAETPSGIGPAMRPNPTAQNPIQQENRQPGTRRWQAAGLQQCAASTQ